jgi:hypothetical protein
MDTSLWPDQMREFVERLGVEEVIAREGGFDLMRTRDGVRWHCVTRNGFDNAYNCGVRTMVSTPLGLAVGTVNSFGPEVAVHHADGWRYEPNPRGGLEVWLGRRAEHDCPAEDSPLVVGHAEAEKPQDGGPARRRMMRVPEKTAAELELSPEALAELKRRIDVQACRPDFVANAYKYHHLSDEGIENIPREGPFILACNHVGSAVFANTSLIPEDVILCAHHVLEIVGRPLRILVDWGFYDTALADRLCRKTNEQLGCVPITVGNGQRLLDAGESLLIYPEGRISEPDYTVRPFFWGFARMAWPTNAPIVPVAFVGPHESRQRVEREGVHLFLNTYKPLPADYKFVFLPPVHVRDHVPSLEDKDALRAFCALVRQVIQDAIDRECRDRPLMAQIRALQRSYGSG